MPSSEELPRQPAVPQTPPAAASQLCGAAALQDKLQRIASQIGDADRRHCDALKDLEQRLALVGRQIEIARTGLPEQQASALGRIEDGIAGLADRISHFARARQSGKTAVAETPVLSLPGDPEAPWDAQSAEALTRVCEQAAAEPAGARPPSRPAREPMPAPPAEPPGINATWLEARLAEMAALLRGALASAPERSFAALDRRLELFEQRLEQALGQRTARFGREEVAAIEAHIAELAGHFEATRRQLARLDAIEAQLAGLARALEGARPGGGLTEAAIERLLDSAAERAASRVAATPPVPSAAPAVDAESRQRLATLEELLQEYVAERRRDEEATAGILHTMEAALMRIADRVDAMEVAQVAARGKDEADAGDAEDALDAEGRRLAEAYAAGARVLGARPLEEPAPDAADYVAAVGGKAPAGARLSAPDIEAARHELSASAIRAKLKAQSRPAEAPATAPPLGAARPGAIGQGRGPERPARRFGVLLPVAIALLAGAGYLAVDTFVGDAPTGGIADGPAGGRLQPASTTTLEKETPRPASAAGVGEDAPAGDASDADAPASAPMPRPAKHDQGPRRITDEAAPEEASDLHRPAGLRSGENVVGDARALVPAALIDTGGPRAAAPPGREPLPAAIGTEALRLAASGGDASAQLEVATRFAEGKGVARDDELAVLWFQRAAQRGLAAAQFRLAACYERGLGVAQDRERAKVWYRRAAEQGHARAAHSLAVLIAGEERDEADGAAAGWFRRAAEGGLAESQFVLAVLYESGRGVGRSLPEAYKWYSLAVRGGQEAAAGRLRQIRQRLAPAEVEAADRELALWTAQAAARHGR